MARSKQLTNEITADLANALYAQTGAAMSVCVNVLVAAKGNLAKAARLIDIKKAPDARSVNDISLHPELARVVDGCLAEGDYRAAVLSAAKVLEG